ncbi:hypothetical protein AA313_de0200421 [Arthrobotrys entomopaga]|nr:hypothetical protein AA313_de0200421 [Arthrobotrys entomopaga]
MAPIDDSQAIEILEFFKLLAIVNGTDFLAGNSTSKGTSKFPAPGSPQWTDSLNANSVQLIAMLVSDAGIAAEQPQWWNAAPLGCLLIGIQPRGGWQIFQRAVQWGQDRWSKSFGVSCPPNVLYQYFTCSIRNRIEVWNSQSFDSPTLRLSEEENEPRSRQDSNASTIEKGLTRVTTAGSELDTVTQKPKQVNKWQHMQIDDSRDFNMARPSKLVDGSRGGQGFMCELLRPKEGATYTIEEQAYWQYVSIVLVVAALLKNGDHRQWRHVLAEDFQVDHRLGKVFSRLRTGLIVFNVFTIILIVTVAYSMFEENIYKGGLSFVIQLVSLFSWAFGAVGLLMMGGNPRVEMVHQSIPEHIQERINDGIERASSSLFNENRSASYGEREFVLLQFGYLSGSTFTPSSHGACKVHREVIQEICSKRLQLIRPWTWILSMIWFLLFLGISVALLIAGSLVATIYSQVLAVGILVLTAVARGWGISGSEEWMIPRHFMRKGAGYGTKLLGKMESRAKA